MFVGENWIVRDIAMKDQEVKILFVIASSPVQYCIPNMNITIAFWNVCFFLGSSSVLGSSKQLLYLITTSKSNFILDEILKKTSFLEVILLMFSGSSNIKVKDEASGNVYSVSAHDITSASSPVKVNVIPIVLLISILLNLIEWSVSQESTSQNDVRSRWQ